MIFNIISLGLFTEKLEKKNLNKAIEPPSEFFMNNRSNASILNMIWPKWCRKFRFFPIIKELTRHNQALRQ